MRKLLAILLTCSLILCAACALAEDDFNLASLYKNRDTDPSWVEANAWHVTFADGAVTHDAGDRLRQDGTVVTLQAAGDWVLSGSWEGQIVISVAAEENIHLILNGLTVTAARGPALREDLADKLILTLAPGTENAIVSKAEGLDGIDSALYTEDDLSVNGGGSLSVTSAGHGIYCRADLILASGTIRVVSGRDAVRGRNSVLLLDGTLDLQSGGDGLCATRENKSDKGWMVLAGGSVKVLAGNGDPESGSQKDIKAITELTVLGGTYDLTCADDGVRADQIRISGGHFTIDTGDEPIQATTTLHIENAVLDVTSHKD